MAAEHPLEAKVRRLASDYNGSRPVIPLPESRQPQRLQAVVPQHTQAQLQAVIQQEQAKHQKQLEDAKLAAAKMAERQESSYDKALADLHAMTAATPAAPPPVEPGAEKPEAALSTYDLEVLQMAEQLDPGELIMNGVIATELEVLPGVFTVSVQTLKKADWVEIHKDVDNFRRGAPADHEKPDGRWITPFPGAVESFYQLRYLAQGVLGVNGMPYPGDWMQRSAMLEDLPDAAYAALVREYDKLLVAVKQLFPDKSTKAILEKLKARLGKAPAHP